MLMGGNGKEEDREGEREREGERKGGRCPGRRGYADYRVEI
jgi:hypothetical protein